VLLLVHAAPATLAAHRRPNLGVLATPQRFYRDVDGWPWAADNGAFSRFDEHLYLMMLDWMAELPPPIFVTVPDVVGDAEATLALYEEWEDALGSRGLPRAFVAQDGLVAGDARVPWDRLECLFIGGKDDENGFPAFKLGETAALLVREAKERGKWVHIGRVNSPPRMRYCRSIGADSIDGSTHNRFRNIYLDRGVASAAAPPQERLVP
jgi:hypothetical protein